MIRAARIVIAIALVVSTAGLAACTSNGEQAKSPVVAAPAIGQEGVLRAGIDLSTAPFGGVGEGREAGIDVDVAAALADRLGLELEVVDVAPSEAATALADGTADIVLSVPFTQTSAAGIASAGTYLTDGPAFFVAVEGTASVEPSLTLDTLNAPKVGVQGESLAYWTLRYELGEAALKKYASLRSALMGLAEGEVEVVAGDAFVGAYIARDVAGVAFAGQAGAAEPLAVVVAEENIQLGDAVRDALDSLAADGVLDTIRRKWVGELPALEDLSAEDEPAGQ